MLQISGIDRERVRLYGKPFLKIIREAFVQYQGMTEANHDRPCDPNHQNVIDISSDDEYGDDDLDELAGDGSQEEQRSQYFRPAPDVEKFNARREWRFFPSCCRLTRPLSQRNTEHSGHTTSSSTASESRRRPRWPAWWHSRWRSGQLQKDRQENICWWQQSGSRQVRSEVGQGQN